MGKWIAVILVGCALVGFNVYLLTRAHSLEQKHDTAQGQIHQLRNSAQQGFNNVGADVGGLRRQLDVRFGQVDSKQLQLEQKIQGLGDLEIMTAVGAPATTAGRYQLARGELPGKKEVHKYFLFDTETGRMWGLGLADERKKEYHWVLLAEGPK